MNFVFHLSSMLEDLLNAGAIIVGSPDTSYHGLEGEKAY